MQNLGVFDTVPARIAREFCNELFIGVQDLAVTGIANRVNSNLQAASHNTAHIGFHLLLADKQQAPVAGIITVIFQQGSAATAQSAVSVQLYRAHHQAAGRVIDGAVFAQPCRCFIHAIGHGVNPKRKLPPLIFSR